jgi:hypothetical protein
MSGNEKDPGDSKDPTKKRQLNDDLVSEQMKKK